jgi:O-antigen ligase
VKGGIPAVTILLAASIQVNVTLPISQSGLRVSIADLVLPVAAVAVLVPLLKTGWPARRWANTSLPIWIAGMTAVLIVSFLVGYSRSGSILPWAFYNKLLGWFVLMAYLLVGACIVWTGGKHAVHRFLTAFCLTAIGIAALSSVGFPLFGQLDTLPILLQDFRLTGFVQNSNAFGFLIVVALCLSLGEKPVNHWFIVALITALFFTGSRGAMLAGAGAAIILFAINRERLRPLKKAVPWSICTIAVIGGTHYFLAQLSSNNAITIQPDRFDIAGATITQRVELGKLALQLFADSPVFGAGLGVFQQAAVAAGHPVNGSTIHSSPLWLLTETGIVGMAVFAGFFVTFLRYFYRDRQNTMSQSMLAIMVAFAIMACTGEFIYQRYLWLLFGMMIAVQGPYIGKGNKKTV